MSTGATTPHWRETHAAKLMSAEQAAALVRPGDTVFVASDSGTPSRVVRALAERERDSPPVKVITSSAASDAQRAATGGGDSLLYAPLYAAGSSPPTRVDVTVVDPALAPRVLDADVVVLRVGPPDPHGYCSLASSAWYQRGFLDRARVAIGEIEEGLPRLARDTSVRVSQLTALVETAVQAAEGWDHVAPREPGDRATVFDRIASRALSLIRDGDTIQVAPSPLLDPLVAQLREKRDLGIHSEVVSGGLIDLVRLGVANGARKPVHAGKAVGAAFRPASDVQADFLDGNPAFESYGVEHVNDPRVIAAHDQVTAIGVGERIDLTGQVANASTSERPQHLTGGQLDFQIGALLAANGRAITCLSALQAGGEASSIVSALPVDAVVTIPRTFVDYVVTEFGVVKLQGKTQRQRALALISIAHPDQRAALEADARRLFWSSD